MIKRLISRARRELTIFGAAALFAAALTGCGPDCYVEATVTITIDPSVEVTPGRHLIIHSVAKKEDADVTGTDPRGLPLGPAVDRETGHTEELQMNTRNYTIEVQTEPYPTWYYAFIDIMEDEKPGAGEPLGVAAGNPFDSGCSSSTISIAVMPAGP